MLGGRIVGEGVDGCVLSEPMWPCASGSQGVPETGNSRYVSKIVLKTDTEAENLKSAARILGKDLASKYLAGLAGECSPANSSHPPNPKNVVALKSSELHVKQWSKRGLACDSVKKKLEKGLSNSKVMFITKYPSTVENWANKLRVERISYKRVLPEVERAIPQFILVLQKFYQDPSEELINIDLHTGNIFVRTNPFEFGIADFGNCVFRRQPEEASRTFYGRFLIDFVVRHEFYSGYSQIPLEARILNYCFRKKLDDVPALSLIKAWENDESVKMYAGSKDTIVENRSILLNHLTKKILFIAMVESIQSISKKLRVNPTNSTKLYETLTILEKTVIDFILTRYHIISPINTITQEIMKVYLEPISPKLTTYILRGIRAPYDQDGPALLTVLNSIKGADFGILWNDIVTGLVV
jgi:hypothetical protein